LQACAHSLLLNKTNHLQTDEPQHIPGQQQVNLCRLFLLFVYLFSHWIFSFSEGVGIQLTCWSQQHFVFITDQDLKIR